MGGDLSFLKYRCRNEQRKSGDSLRIQSSCLAHLNPTNSTLLCDSELRTSHSTVQSRQKSVFLRGLVFSCDRTLQNPDRNVFSGYMESNFAREQAHFVTSVRK